MAASMDGKTVIVTGSGRGIGKAIALKFGAHGANVIVATRTASHGQATVDQICSDGGKAELYQTELESKNVIDDMVAHVIDAYGAVDVVIHNAATAIIGYLEELEEELIDKSFEINVKAGVWLTKAVIPCMKKQGGGRVLFTSSVTSQRALAGATAYAISKAGLNAFIRNAALELGKYNITVNGIEPGITKTDALEKHKFEEEELRQILACIPLGHMGSPDDMAETMLFLASEGARYITGQTVVVDGGLIIPECGAFLIQGR